MNDSWNLDRFVEAQNPVYHQVCSELKQGRKISHWIWFIFPQIAGLGHSPMAKRFALSSLEEAKKYFDHLVLGMRLKECTRLVNGIEGSSVQEIFGSIDGMKFRSSMTLFVHATTDNQCFEEALQKYFGGEYDQLTVERI